MMHSAPPEHGRYLRLALNGFYKLLCCSDQFPRTQLLLAHHVSWQHCLRRRGQRLRLTCQRMMRIAAHFSPNPKLRHPYPDWRFDVMTRGGSPVR
jgi:hypothetical protein